MSGTLAGLHPDPYRQWSYGTTTTMDEEPGEPSYDVASEEAEEARNIIHVVVAAPPDDHVPESLALSPSAIPRKDYWALLGEGSRSLADSIYEVLVQALEYQIGHAGEEITTTSLWTSGEPDLEQAPWRGVFTMPYPRKTIFSREVEIHTSALPRWKPTITLDRRRLEGEHE